MNQKVAVVTTGGTIGSVLSDSVRQVDTDSNTIASKISDHCDELGVDLEIVPAVNMLSENMEPADWSDVGKNIYECCNSGYESIVVTHGTDTLVYSANAFRNAIDNLSSRVVFTGSLASPDDPNNDVEIALRSSLEASIDNSLSEGVYVSFRSPKTNDKAHLHRAVDIQPMRMDDRGFSSLFDSIVGTYSWNDGWNWTEKSSPTSNETISGLGGIPNKEHFDKIIGDVQYQKTFPGQVFNNIDDETSLPDVLVVGLYHSGTASTSLHESGLRDLLRNHDKTSVLLVGMSSKIISPPYESTAKLIDEGARLITDVQAPVIYTAMCVGLANGMGVDEILSNVPGTEVTTEDLEI